LGMESAQAGEAAGRGRERTKVETSGHVVPMLTRKINYD
jgi:hypothetical protein